MCNDPSWWGFFQTHQELREASWQDTEQEIGGGGRGVHEAKTGRREQEGQVKMRFPQTGNNRMASLPLKSYVETSGEPHSQPERLPTFSSLA